jgi:hypothetical protein
MAQIINAAEIAAARAAAAAQAARKAEAQSTIDMLSKQGDIKSAQELLALSQGGGVTGEKLAKKATGLTSVEATRFANALQQKATTIQSDYIDPYNAATAVLGEAPISIPKAVYGQDNAELLALIKSLQDQITLMQKQTQQAQIDAAAQAAATEQRRQQSAIDVLSARFTQYGLQTLVPKIKELAIAGATEDTIALQLQETEEYKTRFRANQDRIKKNLAVLAPNEYLGLEDKYRQILRAYGLRQFDNDNYVTQFIANDVSAAELSSRVEIAVQRVQNADPAVLNTLTTYYGIGTNDLVGYVLDPEQEITKIERKVAAAEIGAAAGLQGIQPGVAVAEQLAAQGITKAQAQKGYSTIADILPTAQKLSEIYAPVLEGYGLAEAEQEVFNTLASAQRKRQRLAEREAAAFSGSSGTGKTSLMSQVGRNF